ncbi:hypothetical protein Pla108_40910 [Botrimarina colliarenosi]|uniref:DprA winged helix domain-containing protein n=1 Tax=Botrimarina colliarenosi TaxID=2528001 RepID=A0A5C5ZZB3_9BACT|nr:hypothetical protein [Botrimarina colliarenosi]TWT92465.1 hypothetical protein Pla108_40910 [Botrimarina colliarenosi]
MTPLERFAALTETHFDIAEVIRDLESEWGCGAPVEKVAHRVGLSELVVVTAIIDLAGVGAVTWLPVERMAFYEDGAPVLGTVQ